MSDLTYYTLDVFTDRPFGGNPLAVIPEAPPLDDDLMQAIAREFNYPETVFVYPAENPGALRKLRIFTPQTELPFAGHPTIGTAQLLVELGIAPPAGSDSEFLLEEDIGLVPITVGRKADGLFSWLSVPQLPQAVSVAFTNESLAAVLGLEPQQIGMADMPGPCAFSAGVPFAFIPLRDREALRGCRLDPVRWRETLAQSAAPQIYAFCSGDAGSGIDFHARMFAPGLGVPEDPATGAAAAAFAGWLWLAAGNCCDWTIAQGEDMQRPSRIRIETGAGNGRLAWVRIGGFAVRVCRGSMRVP